MINDSSRVIILNHGFFIRIDRVYSRLFRCIPWIDIVLSEKAFLNRELSHILDTFFDCFFTLDLRSDWHLVHLFIRWENHYWLLLLTFGRLFEQDLRWRILLSIFTKWKCEPRNCLLLLFYFLHSRIRSCHFLNIRTKNWGF